MTKPFLDIQSQIELLRSRSLEVDSSAANILLKEGYYSIVNGYKKPFLDKERTADEGCDVFQAGTKFQDLYALFCFDRDLREITFKHLLQIEAIVRTVCSYTFAEQHQEKGSYLIQSNFCSESEYVEFGLKNYVDNLLKLQGTLFRMASKSNNEAVVHYRNKGAIPLWVLSKTLTFGNLEHFFHLMKPSERRSVCKRIAEATGRSGKAFPYFDPKQARLSLDPIVKFRNICAHDERLYCAKVGKRSPVTDYSGLLKIVEPFLSGEDYDAFLSDFVFTIVSYCEASGLAPMVIEGSGLSEMLPAAKEAAVRRLNDSQTLSSLARLQVIGS